MGKTPSVSGFASYIACVDSGNDMEGVMPNARKKRKPYIRNVAGIYAIVNRANGHKYVGQSKCLSKRRSAHINQLRRGVHTNKYLQDAFDKYGENNFVFIVLEYEPNLDNLTMMEQSWINELNPEYNANLYVAKDWTEGYRLTGEREYDSKIYVRGDETFERPSWHRKVYGDGKDTVSK